MERGCCENMAWKEVRIVPHFGLQGSLTESGAIYWDRKWEKEELQRRRRWWVSFAIHSSAFETSQGKCPISHYVSKHRVRSEICIKGTSMGKLAINYITGVDTVTHRISRVGKNSSYGESREVRVHKVDWEGVAETGEKIINVRSKALEKESFKKGGLRTKES